ncbi:MAG: hypothetical protein UX80_C0004G0001 [Candidatus Amesbacteria bacterium GW2011_GWA2_47_11b]|uniref:ABC-2 type transporter n=2 Tax=Candidatus Amesiibacteriota TaxID=1752730 RepID=A0A0G1UKJ0_9BACT|nr:MAG: hypothetical protein UX80_C0004G0001 [Candidatus Amesbacteria bacterium GW2011_GWA2_47_11b]KKU84764.1 MAG: hypothetical protein UY11_C0004G0006 [Candidatus Amesbacteria bacterium GW2011_GWC2_47_8]
MRLFVTILQGFITPLFLLLVLSLATPTGGTSVSGLISYFLLVGLIYPLTRSRVNEFIEEQTTSGEINNFLVKPISFYKYLLVDDLSWKILNLLTLAPFIFIACIFLLWGNSPDYNLAILGISVVTTAISFLVSFNFSYLVGLFSFWLDEFWAINNVKLVTVTFLGGVVLPYSFFPDWSNQLLKYSPFPYMLTWPVRVLRGQFEPIEIIISLFWYAVLGLSIKVLQKMAISKYSHTAS